MLKWDLLVWQSKPRQPFHLRSPVFVGLDAFIRLILSSHMTRALRAAERICFLTTGSREKFQTNSGLFFAFPWGGKLSLNHLMVSQSLICMMTDDTLNFPRDVPPNKRYHKIRVKLRHLFDQFGFRAQHSKFYRMSCSMQPAAR